MANEEILLKYFSKDDFGHDVALVVENKEIWVCRGTLRQYSPVFEKMFTADFKEKDSDKIELPGKQFADVFEFVQCLIPYPKIKRITVQNVFILMTFADEYAVEELRDQIERFLVSYVESHVSDSFEKIIEIVCFCVKYKFDNVIKVCIFEIAQIWPYGYIASLYSRDIPTSVIALILDLYVKIQNKVSFDLDVSLFEKFKKGY